MARLFDKSIPQYLQIDEAVISAAYPLTLACWFKTTTDTTAGGLIWIGDKDYEDRWQLLYLQPAQGVKAYSKQGSGGIALSTAAYSPGVWQHACGVFAAANLRAAYVNGGNKGTDTASVTPTGFDRVGIGMFRDSSPSSPVDAAIAEIGIWNAALTDAEVASLAAGFSPLLVRPANLVAYWPLIRDEDIDIVGGYKLTAYGAPTVAVHCPIMRPAVVNIGFLQRGYNWRKIVTEFSSPTFVSLGIQNGWSGSFTNGDAKTVTVVDGIITNVN